MKERTELSVIKWYVLSMILGVIVGSIQPYQPNIIPWIQSFWDASKAPCSGKLVIESPQSGGTVSGLVADVIGTSSVVGDCGCVVVIIDPLSGPRSRFVSDVQPLHNGTWVATARIDSIPVGGRLRISARLCKKPPPYELG